MHVFSPPPSPPPLPPWSIMWPTRSSAILLGFASSPVCHGQEPDQNKPCAVPVHWTTWTARSLSLALRGEIGEKIGRVRKSRRRRAPSL